MQQIMYIKIPLFPYSYCLLLFFLFIFAAFQATEAEAEYNVQEVTKKERLAIGLNCAAAVTAFLMVAAVVGSVVIYRLFGNR